MYAVVNTGGKQYKVQQGEILRVEKIPGEVGSPVIFDRVLMFSDGENINIGQPLLDDIAVEGHIVEQGKAKKIIVFKYKRRKRYRRKKGHRQQYTAVQIDSITAKKAKVKKAPKAADEPKPEANKAEADDAKGKKVEAEKASPNKVAAKKTKAQKETPKKAATEKAAATETEAEKSQTKKVAAKKAEPKEKDKEV